MKIINSNKELMEKYKKFYLELEIMNNPNKKFCPFPNCDSYLKKEKLKNNEVKCLNGHKFCFKCLKEPHGISPCKKILDDSLKEFCKNHFLKKCPKCNIITEKIEGCNHITCTKCNYQWCWLCNEEYNPEHYLEGKCKGYQFFKPKNEKDIKLAFEGKIELNLSQRQIDTYNEFERRGNHRNPHINRILQESPGMIYLFKWGKITRIFLIFIYILFGYDLIILNAIDKYSNYKNLLIFYYLPYKIAFLIWSIYLNIINLIICLFKFGFMDFTSLIYDTAIFKRRYGYFRIIFFKICILFLGFLCLTFFLFIDFGKNKLRIRNKLMLIIYYFISIFIIIIFFPIQLLFNIILIVINIICQRLNINKTIININDLLRIVNDFHYNIDDN